MLAQARINACTMRDGLMPGGRSWNLRMQAEGEVLGPGIEKDRK